DAYRSKRLAMAKDFFVLLLALEVEDQDLIAASGFHYLAADHSALAGADLAFLTGNCEHIVELNGIAFSGGQLLYLNDISGSHSILLPPGANHRVHSSLRLPLASARLERT